MFIRNARLRTALVMAGPSRCAGKASELPERFRLDEN